MNCPKTTCIHYKVCCRSYDYSDRFGECNFFEEQPIGDRIEYIAWKDIKEVQPKDGQQILYSYSFEYDPGKWEHRVKIDTYTSSESCKFPMCYMTHWTEVPEPVVVRN